ncbi:MAG: ATP-grasp domain-containing protein, partial [Nanopusillaceae archaeon]
MKLYEFEAKEIASRYGISTPKGRIASTPDEAERVALEVGKPVVLKVQVLVGGRGLAGGVKFADTPEEAREYAKALLGATIRGEKVEKLLVEEKVCISRELYLSLTIDRATRKPLYLISE